MSSLSKLKYKTIGIFSWLQYLKNLPNFKNATGKLNILFHGIDHANNTSISTKFISVSKFEKQLQLIKKHFQLVDLETLCNSPSENKTLQIAITFDDGFENNFLLAKPILEKYEVPATFFISSPQYYDYHILWADLIDLGSKYCPSKLLIGEKTFYKKGNSFFDENGTSLKHLCTQANREFIKEVYNSILPYAKFMANPKCDTYWKLMTPEQLSILSTNPLFQIGSHGLLHTSIQNLSEEEATEELTLSKQYIETIIKQPVHWFAYPHGSASEQSVSWVKEAGYNFQFLANESDLDQISGVYNRMGVNPFISARAQSYHFFKGKN